LPKVLWNLQYFIIDIYGNHISLCYNVQNDKVEHSHYIIKRENGTLYFVLKCPVLKSDAVYSVLQITSR